MNFFIKVDLYNQVTEFKNVECKITIPENYCEQIQLEFTMTRKSVQENKNSKIYLGMPIEYELKQVDENINSNNKLLITTSKVWLNDSCSLFFWLIDLEPKEKLTFFAKTNEIKIIEHNNLESAKYSQLKGVFFITPIEVLKASHVRPFELSLNNVLNISFLYDHSLVKDSLFEKYKEQPLLGVFGIDSNIIEFDQEMEQCIEEIENILFLIGLVQQKQYVWQGYQ